MLREDDENSCIAVGEPRIIAATQLAHHVTDQKEERIGHPNCQVASSQTASVNHQRARLAPCPTVSTTRLTTDCKMWLHEKCPI